jgi:hypothetical protein
MSFILQPAASATTVTQTKQTIATPIQFDTGYRGLSQSAVTITNPGSVQIPGGQFWQILQTN